MTIREIRKEAGMTQKQFAEYIGVSKRTVESWEEGKRNCPEALYTLIKYKFDKEKLKSR